MFVGGVFVPSYWRYEPRDYAEGFDVTLDSGGAGGVHGSCVARAAARRGRVAPRVATVRAHGMQTRSRRLVLAGTPMPAFEIDAEAPIVALVGVLRPRLLVTRGVVAALTEEELAASVAHEIGHWRALDNLKRLADAHGARHLSR